MAWSTVTKRISGRGATKPASSGPTGFVGRPKPQQVVLNRITHHRCGGCTALDYAEATVRARRSWRLYDPSLPLPQETLRRVLEATTQAPTGFNLQGWTMVVVQEAAQKEALCKAALGQQQVLDAAATIVFAGMTEPERNAPSALELGLECGAIPAGYGPGYLRNIYYFLQGGPYQSLAAAKSVLSSVYSSQTGTPLLSVPVNKTGYAWKQTMIPLTTFIHLATAAGWETCVLEGLDEAAVRRAVGLPDSYTVPAIATVGYPMLEDGAHSKALHTPPSPRFSTNHFIRWNKF